MEGSRLPDRIDRHWRTEGDGSLRGENREWVLREPVDREAIDKVLSYLQGKLSRSRLNPSDRCGVHIHLNVQDLTLPEVIKIGALYYIFEQTLLRFCGEDRTGNLFCLGAKDAEFVLTRLEQGSLWSNFYEGYSYLTRGNIRYAALNWSSLNKFGSLEFRSFRTPTDFSEIATWAKLLLKIKDRATHFKTLSQIVEEFSMVSFQEFFETTFEELAPTLLTDFSEEETYDGLRNIQHILYQEPYKESDAEDIEEVRLAVARNSGRRGKEKSEGESPRRMRARGTFGDIHIIDEAATLASAPVRTTTRTVPPNTFLVGSRIIHDRYYIVQNTRTNRERFAGRRLSPARKNAVLNSTTATLMHYRNQDI